MKKSADNFWQKKDAPSAKFRHLQEKHFQQPLVIVLLSSEPKESVIWYTPTRGDSGTFERSM